MPKFFSDNIKDNIITISSEDVRHIKNVLRLKPGDRVDVCDGNGFDYVCEISEIKDREIECVIKTKQAADAEPPIEVTLFQGLPKGSKTDYIIQKTTELGIAEIVPCELARCVAKIEDGKTAEKKVGRWQKIAEEAAKQSGRGIIPKVKKPVELAEAIKYLKEKDLAFALYECESDKCLKKTLTEHKNAKTVGFMIGPEGGFDPCEIELLHKEGIKSVGLGKRILRTETAGEAVLSMIMYEIGDINN